jgi:hypothetical protein
VAGKEVTLVAAEVHHVHQPLAHAHHLLQLCLYTVQRHVVHRQAHVLGQLVHSRAVSYYQDQMDC